MIKKVRHHEKNQAFYFFQTIPEVNKTMQFNKNMKAVKSI